MGNDGNDSSLNPAAYGFMYQPDNSQSLSRTVIFEKTISRLGQVATRTDLRRLKHFLTEAHPLPNRDAVIGSLRNAVHHSSSDAPKSDFNQLTPRKVQDKPESELGDSMMEKVEKLKRVLERSSEVLASATTVFPFTLFRDKIIVDRTKITILKKSFFQTDEVMSIRIEDVLNVKATYGPFFGSVTIAVRVLSSEDHHSIDWLWRDDAINLKHIIQGYIIAHHNKIDCRDQDKDELIRTLTELGHDSNGAHAGA